jgi:hypothetical protein
MGNVATMTSDPNVVMFSNDDLGFHNAFQQLPLVMRVACFVGKRLSQTDRQD